jgi:hypothetical protein
MGHPDCAGARVLFDFRGECRHTGKTLMICDAAVRCCLILFVTQGMYGKRGETPPLPRNCEARTFG